MDRQAVGEALKSLPDQQRQVVKLAYFGGLTNREIAEQVGLPVSGVRRRLREALATVSVYVERSRAAGSKVVYALLAWFGERWLDAAQRTSGKGVEEMLRAGMVVAAGVTASAVLGAQPVSPAQIHLIGLARIPAVSSVQAGVVQAPTTTILATAAALPQSSVVGSALIPRSGVPSLPVTVIVTVPAPGLPNLLSGSLKVPGPINLQVPTPAVPVLPRLPH